MKNEIWTDKPMPDAFGMIDGLSFQLARLMSPLEVAEATEAYPRQVMENMRGKWALCGDVSKRMFSAMKDSIAMDLASRLTVFKSACGGAYAVVTNQMGACQHRFLLPTYHPTFEAYLRVFRSEPLVLSLGDAGGEDCLVYACPIEPNAFMPMVALAADVARNDVGELILELPLVIAEMFDPDRIPSMTRGQKVKNVSVSILMPLSDISSVTGENFWGAEHDRG
jgi:hypothetical protein